MLGRLRPSGPRPARELPRLELAMKSGAALKGRCSVLSCRCSGVRRREAREGERVKIGGAGS